MEFLKDMGPRVQGPNQMNQSIQGLFILAGGTASLWNKGSASELLCTHSSFKGPWIGAAGPGGVKVQSGSSRASGKWNYLGAWESQRLHNTAISWEHRPLRLARQTSSSEYLTQWHVRLSTPPREPSVATEGVRTATVSLLLNKAHGDWKHGLPSQTLKLFFSFTWRILTEHLFCAKHWARHWMHNGDPDKWFLTSWGLLCRWTINKELYTRMCPLFLW